MNRYQPLGEYLETLDANPVALTFPEIERIIRDDLPYAARNYRPWWANGQSHTQARSWLSVGWRTGNVNMGGETATFRR